MRSAREIAAEAFERRGLLTIAAEIRGGTNQAGSLAAEAIEQAQREAIAEAAKVARSFETKDWESYDPRTIANAICTLLPGDQP